MSDAKHSFDGNGILIVDGDEGFLADAKRMFEGGVDTAGSLADAQRALAGGNVDLIVLGPSFATERGIRDAGSLVEEDAGLAVVLVAGATTATLLRAAMRAGFVDVIEAPLDQTKMAEAIGQAERLNRREAKTLICSPRPTTRRASASSMQTSSSATSAWSCSSNRS